MAGGFKPLPPARIVLFLVSGLDHQLELFCWIETRGDDYPIQVESEARVKRRRVSPSVCSLR